MLFRSTAFEGLRATAQLLIEVGPGNVLAGLVRDNAEVSVVALDAGGDSLKGLLQAVGAAFALGAPVKTAALFADRFTRPFALDWQPKFFANPCESAPVAETAERRPAFRAEAKIELGPTPFVPVADAPIELIRCLVAERAELDRKSTRLNSSHLRLSRMPSSA